MQRIRYLFALYRNAFGPYTPQLILICVLAAISSIFEGLGITAIIPIFSFVGGAAGALPTDTISRFIAASYAFVHVSYSFRTLLMGIAILFVARIIVLFVIQYITGRIVFSYERDMRRQLFSAFLASEWPYLSRQKTGNFEQLVTTNASNASQLFGMISTMVIVASKTLMYVVIAVNVSWWVAIFSLVLGALVFFLLQPLMRKNRLFANQAEANNRELAHFSSEHMLGMKALKSSAIEDKVRSSGERYFERNRILNLNLIILRSIVQAVIQFSGVFFIAIVFFIMYRSPGFSIAAFAVIVYAVNQIFSQVQMSQSQLQGFTALTPYLAQLINARDEAQDHSENIGGDKKFSFGGKLVFDNVSFSYPDRASAALSGAAFTIKRGEITGLIGPSGAGKTTVADLLLRLIDAQEGSVRVDGTDVREISVHDWREHIGYVPQEAVLLDDTIENNIRFYDENLSKDDVIAAAHAADIHDFIVSLSGEYATMVGDRGIALSGGQRQRIALARALARRPALLILDEATSALDRESEEEIKQSVEKLRGSSTVLIIAHRMSTVANADTIIVLEKGKTVEEGSAEALRSDPDSYFSRMLRGGSVDL